MFFKYCRIDGGEECQRQHRGDDQKGRFLREFAQECGLCAACPALSKTWMTTKLAKVTAARQFAVYQTGPIRLVFAVGQGLSTSI